MAQGTERRQGTPDSLAGAAEIVPVLSKAPALQVSNSAVPDVVNSPSAKIARSLNKWAGDKLQAVANIQHETSILDGQMAYQQGAAMDALEMEGDKWAMSGYRVMHAQTLSSTMLASQQEMIRQSQYEQNPEQFRATYVARLEAQLDGLDPETAKMVREQMVEHMPTLVSQHTTAYMANEEQNAFDALSASVHPMSGDPTAFEALIANAKGGEGTASAGLSSDRTRAAVVAGTVAAFNQNNPVAFQQLKASGVLDELPDAERQSILAAQKTYETRVRQTYDEEFNVELQEFQRKLNADGFDSAQAAVDRISEIYSSNGLNITMTEAGAAYSGAKTAGDLGDRADVIVLEAATVSGDWKRVAALTQDIVMHYESGGDPNAVSSAGAEGLMQVMPATQENPGFGIRPSDGTKADTVRVGREYWAMLVERYKGNIEAAAIGYNAGPGNADKWIAAGGGEAGYALLPDRAQTEPYAKGISNSANGGNLYYSSSERLSMADSKLKAAKKLRDALMEQTDLDQEHQYKLAIAPVASLLEQGLITTAEFQAKSDELRAVHKVEMTKGVSASIISDVERGINAAVQREAAANKDAETELEKNNIAGYQAEVAVVTDAFKAALADPTKSSEQIEEDQAAYLQQVNALAQARGLELHESKFATILKDAGTASREARADNLKYKQEQDMIDAAFRNNTISSLPKALQDRHQRQQSEELLTLISDAVATGALPEDAAQTAFAAGQTANWIQAGTVPSDVKAHASAIMSREMLTQDGEPNPETLAVIKQWGELHSTNPEVARTMLDEAGHVRVRAVLANAGGNFASDDAIMQAMTANQRQIDSAAAGLSGIPTVDAQRVQDRAWRATKAFMAQEDFGFWQGATNVGGDTTVSQMFSRTADEEAKAFSTEEREDLSGLIVQEAVRIEKVSPGQTAKFYTDMAAENVLGRTSVVGESVLTMAEGFDLKTQMFGEASNQMTNPGTENEVILQAIRNAAENDPDTYGWATETLFREQMGLVGTGVAGAFDAVAGLFGSEVNMPKISGETARQSWIRGVRPYRVLSFDNQKVIVQVMNGNGNYLTVPVDMAGAGATYRAEYLEGLANTATHALQEGAVYGH